MKKLLFLLALLAVLWEAGWTLAGVKPLFPWQLAEELQPRHPELILLDVRTPREFQWFHIPGATNVPYVPGGFPNLNLPQDKTVVVICLTGHRSPLVAWRLKQRGYEKVYNLVGGMAGWQAYLWVSGSRPQPATGAPTEEAALRPGVAIPAFVRGARS